MIEANQPNLCEPFAKRVREVKNVYYDIINSFFQFSIIILISFLKIFYELENVLCTPENLNENTINDLKTV